MGLAGLTLFSVACRAEIYNHLRWRRFHVSSNGLTTLIFLAQGISGPRDLLEIPLSWGAHLSTLDNVRRRLRQSPLPKGSFS
jgi:hypothetical protein